jgi:hypothetical protein
MIGISVNVANVLGRALVDGGCGGELLTSRTLQTGVELTMSRRVGKELSGLMELYSPCGERRTC